MKRVPFSDTGITVSEMCLGTMMFGGRCSEEEADKIVGRALDAGVDFFDTAAMYEKGETERILGRILKGRRDKVFLATKVHAGVDGATIRRSIDESLERLQTDYVDLYLIHWPREGMRPLEVMEALHDVVKAGKARFVGCCNFPAYALAMHNRVAVENGWTDALLRSHQIPYNPIERGAEVEVLPQGIAENLCVTVYRPLVGGLLTGKYRAGRPIPENARGQSDERLPRWLERFGDGVEYLIKFADQRGLAPAQVAVAWLRSHPAVTCPIVGVSRLEQFEQSFTGFEVELTDQERDALTETFGAEVREEAGGAYKDLRRNLALIG